MVDPSTDKIISPGSELHYLGEDAMEVLSRFREAQQTLEFPMNDLVELVEQIWRDEFTNFVEGREVSVEFMRHLDEQEKLPMDERSRTSKAVDVAFGRALQGLQDFGKALVSAKPAPDETKSWTAQSISINVPVGGEICFLDLIESYKQATGRALGIVIPISSVSIVSDDGREISCPDEFCIPDANKFATWQVKKDCPIGTQLKVKITEGTTMGLTRDQEPLIGIVTVVVQPSEQPSK